MIENINKFMYLKMVLLISKLYAGLPLHNQHLKFNEKDL